MVEDMGNALGKCSVLISWVRFIQFVLFFFGFALCLYSKTKNFHFQGISYKQA